MRTYALKMSMIVGTLLLLAAGPSAAAPDGGEGNRTATLPASQLTAAGTDWPQWRGPNRDGVAPAGPKLLDSWPKEGPKLLWKSDTIPTRSLKESKNDDVGGSSCPIVSDGKVFLFVHWKHQAGKFLITTQMLKDFGWEEGVPDDLAKKIEAARLSDKRKDLAGAALDAYIKEFMAAVDPELAKKFDAHIKLRLTQGREALSWEQDFAHLVKARDKEFPTFNALVSAVDDAFNPGTHGHPGSDKIMPLFVEFFLNKVFQYTDTIVCLDAATGKELWKKEFPGELPERECHWPNSGTPAIVKDRMYVAGSAGLYCLAVKDGALVWHVKAMLGHSSPLVADGRIYIYEGDPDKNRCANRSAFFGVGMLTAYSAEDGRLLWHQPKVKYTNGSVALWTHGGKNYLISGAAGGPYCVDPETGDVLWAPPAGAPRVPGSWTNHGTPAVSGDIVVLYADPQMAFKMTPQKAELLWKMPGGSRGASPLIYQDHAYFFGGQGNATCVELKTGVVKWNKRDITGECSSPVLADGKLFYLPVCRQWYLPRAIGMFNAAPAKFEELGRFPAWVSEIASPAIAGGKLYVRMWDHVACYDLTQYGPYVDKTLVTKDNVTFVFKQTGGHLVAKDAADGLKDIVITDATGAAKPAKATMAGDTIVVDIKDVPVPFGISCGAINSLAGKDGQPVPAFGWSGTRVLKHRKCFDNTIVLTSNLYLDGTWNNVANYIVTGATVTDAKVDPLGKGVTLTTDKAWKTGDAVTVTYPCFHVDQGGARREKLTFTAPEIQRAAAKFVKTDETTSGNWKGIYGAEGAVIVGDAAATTPTCAIVTPVKKDDYTWPGTTTDARAPQRSAGAKDRVVACWVSNTSFDIDIELTDGKEHQVALYCLDWDGHGRAATVEVRDALTNAVLDTQAVKEYKNGKYLVWNLKGQVTLHIVNTAAGNSVVASGIFFDAPGKTSR